MSGAPAIESAGGVSVGVESVRLARRTLEELATEWEPTDPAERYRDLELPPAFDERRGVFVTLLKFPSEALRGCIGFPRAALPLRAAVPRAAYAAAREDPRFRPVTRSELSEIIVEVSLLSTPERLSARPRRTLPRQVMVGRDGLIVEGLGSSGLILPQVAPEQGWDATAFLDGACEKAGLPARGWLAPEIAVYRFQARVYREERPGGPIIARAS